MCANRERSSKIRTGSKNKTHPQDKEIDFLPLGICKKICLWLLVHKNFMIVIVQWLPDFL